MVITWMEQLRWDCFAYSLNNLFFPCTQNCLYVVEITVNICLNQLSEKGQDQGSEANPVTIIELSAVTGTDGAYWLCQLKSSCDTPVLPFH